MRRGDIVEFKRKGFVSKVLGGLLKLFERDWDGWGWHLAIAWDKAYEGWYILEATAMGQKINYYSDEHLAQNSRSWEWLDKIPTQKQMGKFLESHIDKAYDVTIYAHTIIQYLLLRAIEWFQNKFIPWHKFTISLPHVLNERYSCWELTFNFCRFMGKPVQESIGLSSTRYPLISDFLKAIKSTKQRARSSLILVA